MNRHLVSTGAAQLLRLLHRSNLMCRATSYLDYNLYITCTAEPHSEGIFGSIFMLLMIAYLIFHGGLRRAFYIFRVPV